MAVAGRILNIGGLKMKVYTIGEVSKQMGLSVEAIRYYDREGLLPFVKRDAGGRRQFTEDNIQLMAMIMDLKRAGDDYGFKARGCAHQRHCLFCFVASGW